MHHSGSVFVAAGFLTSKSYIQKETCSSATHNIIAFYLFFVSQNNIASSSCLHQIPHAHILSTNRFLAKDNRHRLAAKFSTCTKDLAGAVSLCYRWHHADVKGNHNTDKNLWFEKCLFSCDRKTVQELRRLFATPHINVIPGGARATWYSMLNTLTLESSDFCSTLYFNQEWYVYLYKWSCERKVVTERSNVSSLRACSGWHQSLIAPRKLSAVTKEPAD